MDYVRLGATGLKVSRLCLGAFLEDACVPHRILGHH